MSAIAAIADTRPAAAATAGAEIRLVQLGQMGYAIVHP
jgi:hypothetical protein